MSFSSMNESFQLPNRDWPEIVRLLSDIPAGRRGSLLQCALTPARTDPVSGEFDLELVRARFAEYWESTFRLAFPSHEIRAALDPPVPIKTVLEFCNLSITRNAAEIDEALQRLIVRLLDRLREMAPNPQSALFSFEPDSRAVNGQVDSSSFGGAWVRDLGQLIEAGKKYSTIYADPPWAYENKSARGAAANHYPTMSVNEICQEPIGKLIGRNAHLHLWTTNAFLNDAFRVVEAWGFKFKSCFVWVKDELGLGNYWRVSHEFLLLGVRGTLTFQDRTLASWIRAPRTAHSRKPKIVRELIERVSPGPYLELYGREELPHSAWDVYGNQVERRLF